jgi:ABC-type transport system substrate-binding protein
MSQPSPTPTATTAPRVPVASRLKIGMVPVDQQVTMTWKATQSAGGPIKGNYEMLIGNDPKTLEPNDSGLAESWTVGADGKSLAFKLRKGVNFHSTSTWQGTEFSAKDVILSIRTIAQDDSLAFPAIFKDLGIADQNFESPDKYSITHKFNKVDPLAALRYNYVWVLAMISQDYMDTVGMEGYLKQPVGTGPFQFVELKLNESILHKRVENHWRQTPEFHELEIIYFKETSTRLAALLSKEIHVADISRSLRSEATGQGFKIAKDTIPSFSILFGYNRYYDQPREIKAGANKGQILPVAPGYKADDPLRDVNVRKAINLATNRDLINQTFLLGEGLPLRVHQLPPTRADHKSSWTQYPFDPNESKRLLAQAGYANGFEVDLLWSDTVGVPEAGDITEAFANMLKDVGITAKLQKVEFGTAILAKQRARDLGRTIFLSRLGYGGDPAGSSANAWCFPMSLAAGGCGVNWWEYEELEDPYVKLVGTIDQNERIKIIQEIGDWMYNNHIIFPLHFIFAEYAYDPGVISEYEAARIHFGPTVFVEYAKPVFK